MDGDFALTTTGNGAFVNVVLGFATRRWRLLPSTLDRLALRMQSLTRKESPMRIVALEEHFSVPDLVSRIASRTIAERGWPAGDRAPAAVVPT